MAALRLETVATQRVSKNLNVMAGRVKLELDGRGALVPRFLLKIVGQDEEVEMYTFINRYSLSRNVDKLLKERRRTRRLTVQCDQFANTRFEVLQLRTQVAGECGFTNLRPNQHDKDPSMYNLPLS